MDQHYRDPSSSIFQFASDVLSHDCTQNHINQVHVNPHPQTNQYIALNHNTKHINQIYTACHCNTIKQLDWL
jgi:hypothetical protein